MAVVSHSFWRRRFGGDPSVVGSAFTFGEKRLEIVGVAQESFTGIEPGRLVDLWVPVSMYDAGGFTFTNPEWNFLGILGRLNPGVIPERARGVPGAVQPVPPGADGRTTRARDPPIGSNDTSTRRSHWRRPPTAPRDYEVSSTGRSGFSRSLSRSDLLISVSNVANLYLARAAGRAHEMSLRLSIGASRSRLVQQMLIESVLLAAVAGVLGLLFARVAGPSIIAMLAPSTNPVYLELRIDWRLLAFLCIAGALTTMLFGLAPALRASRVAPLGALRGGEPRATSRTGLPRPLVAVQVSFSLAILFVAGLLLLSFGRLANTDVGFAKDGVLLVRVDSRDRLDPEMARIAGPQLLERVRSVPGVSNASLSARPLFPKVGRSPVSAWPDTSPTHLSASLAGVSRFLRDDAHTSPEWA